MNSSKGIELHNKKGTVDSAFFYYISLMQCREINRA